MNDLAKNILLWVIVAIILMSVFNNLSTTSSDNRISYSEFLQNVQQNQVSDVTISESKIEGTLQTGSRFKTYSPETDNTAMIGDLMKHGVKINAKPVETSIWTQIFISWFPFLLIIGLWIFFIRQMQVGGGKAMSFGKSRARVFLKDQGKKVTFKDVAVTNCPASCFFSAASTT